jgi:hypothetical protein
MESIAALLKQYNALAASPLKRWRKSREALVAAIAELPKPAPRGGVDSFSSGGSVAKEPKAPAIMNIAPQAEAKACRANTNQSLCVDMLHKGATVAEITSAVNAQRAAGGKANMISESVIRGTISYDCCKVKGYGVTERDGRRATLSLSCRPPTCWCRLRFVLSSWRRWNATSWPTQPRYRDASRCASKMPGSDPGYSYLGSEEILCTLALRQKTISRSLECAHYLAYCSSLTFSIHSTFLPLTTFVIAIWPIELVVVAPCQCFTPGGHQTTSPGLITRFSPPSSCTHPVPDVTIRIWPAGCVCHAERAPGSKVTWPPVEAM